MSDISRLRNLIITRQGAYKGLFKGPLADLVLADMAAFCRAHESTFHENARIAAMLDGRREVWLRVSNHLHMSPEALFRLSTGFTGEGEIPMIDPEIYHE